MSHAFCPQSTQYLVTGELCDLLLSSSSHISQTNCGALVALMLEYFLSSTSCSMKKFPGKFFKPSSGMVNSRRQKGQGSFASGPSSSPYLSRHSRQNVCRHGRALGFLNVSRQIPHSVMS